MHLGTKFLLHVPTSTLNTASLASIFPPLDPPALHGVAPSPRSSHGTLQSATTPAQCISQIAYSLIRLPYSWIISLWLLLQIPPPCRTLNGMRYSERLQVVVTRFPDLPPVRVEERQCRDKETSKYLSRQPTITDSLLNLPRLIPPLLLWRQQGPYMDQPLHIRRHQTPGQSRRSR